MIFGYERGLNHEPESGHNRALPLDHALMSFTDDLKARARKLKAEIGALYYAARHRETPWYAKLLVVAIVAYALSPIDLIPDFIPVIGFLDEVLLLPLGIVLAIRLIPAHVMAECRARAAETERVTTRAGVVAAAVIAVVWLAARPVGRRAAAVIIFIWAGSALALAYGLWRLADEAS